MFFYLHQYWSLTILHQSQSEVWAEQRLLNAAGVAPLRFRLTLIPKRRPSCDTEELKLKAEGAWTRSRERARTQKEHGKEVDGGGGGSWRTSLPPRQWHWPAGAEAKVENLQA